VNKIICSVKDTAVQAFGPVFLMHTTEEAIRSLREAVNSQQTDTPVKKFPDDHELYKVGEWNETSGTIKPNAPELIVRCKDLVQQGA